MLVGWDTLDASTYRHEALESYQSGRKFLTDADAERSGLVRTGLGSIVCARPLSRPGMWRTYAASPDSIEMEQ